MVIVTADVIAMGITATPSKHDQWLKWRTAHGVSKPGVTVNGKRYGVSLYRGCGECDQCLKSKCPEGYGVLTHRARSKLYKSRDSIPVSVLKFIDSTG